jgi:phosphate-selective porin OprO/OprP
MRGRAWVIAAACAALLTANAAGEEAPGRETEKAGASRWRFGWQERPVLVSPGEDLTLELEGVFMADWSNADGDEVEDDLGINLLGDEKEFRRLDVAIIGEVREELQFKFGGDFAGAGQELKGLYIRLLDLPQVGDLTLGHFREPFSLDEMTSSRDITFLERSLPTVFGPKRNFGMMISRRAPDQRLTWALGAFHSYDEYCAG